MDGNREMDVPMREMRSAGLEPVVGSHATAEGGGSLSGVPGVGAFRPGEAGQETESGLSERIAAWRLFAEERVAYWRFAEQIAEGAGLLRDVPYCAWKRAQYEELLECVKRMEELWQSRNG